MNDWVLIGYWLVIFCMAGFVIFWGFMQILMYKKLGQSPVKVRHNQRAADKAKERRDREFKELEKILYEDPQDWIRDGERRAK